VVKLLRQIPSIGPIRAALLVALMQTPHHFRTKRQLGNDNDYDDGEGQRATREGKKNEGIPRFIAWAPSRARTRCSE
jgi:hypothetical protein